MILLAFSQEADLPYLCQPELFAHLSKEKYDD